MDKRLQKKFEKLFDALDEAVRLLSEINEEVISLTEEVKK
jgi:hypothetical protein